MTQCVEVTLTGMGTFHNSNEENTQTTQRYSE